MNSNQSLRVGAPPVTNRAQPARQVTNDKDCGEAGREFQRLMSKKISRSNAEQQAHQNLPTHDSKDSSIQSDVISHQSLGRDLEFPGESALAETPDITSAQPGDGEAAAEKASDAGYSSATPQSTVVDQPSNNSIRDADEFEALIGPQLGQELAPQGNFEVLLPNHHKIGVEYAVSPESIQVLLKASSRDLCMRLRACAEGISSRMSERCGRQVDVFAV